MEETDYLHTASSSPTWQLRFKKYSTPALHIVLALFTFFTTTLAGVLWVNKNPLELANFTSGMPYSLSLLTILTFHEFGHYFAARYHHIKTSLPFYIPFPPFIANPFGGIGELIQLNPFGTMGAVIRIRSPLQTKKALYDIGIAGPIAGLVATLAILIFGLLTLPGKEYLYALHPEYRLLPEIPESGLHFGNSIFLWGLLKLFSANAFVPPMTEIYHYPYLCAGWFGLFITALNLIPVGQLDGGHILYALLGKGQGLIARIFFVALLLLGLTSFLPLFGLDTQPATAGWLIWAAILFFLIKLDHPPVEDATPLDRGRKILGWVTFVIFILSFVPIPIYESM